MKQSQELTSVAQRIRQRRAELKLSLQDVSDLSGISKSTLQRYETGGIKNIHFDSIEKLSRALNTSPDWIFGWTENAEDITPLDSDFKNLLRDLGFHIESWPGFKSRIYLSGGQELGSWEITKEEYDQFRDNVTAYIRFTATNLLNAAKGREEKRMAEKIENCFSNNKKNKEQSDK